MRPHDRAQRTAVPDAAWQHARVGDDGAYRVAFHISPADGVPVRTAEQWARATFEEAPRRWRWFLVIGWTAITCRLERRPSSTTVLGWHIDQASPDVAVLAVKALVGFTSRIVASVGADGVTLSSFVEFSGPTAGLARLVWTLTIPLHERVLPHLLTAAARREAPTPR